jgi:thioredoxin-like negative regulator of GroEL
MLALGIDAFTGTRPLDSRDILALFYAKWCPFSRSFLMIFEKTVKDKTEPLGALVDISDTNNPLWETFQVEIVPTLIGFKNGKTVVRKDGVAGVGLEMHELLDALRTMEER